MEGELVLPAFQMDCRNWLVITPEETGLPDEIAGAPLLAVLSTAIIGTDELRSVSAVLTLGLLDEDEHRSVGNARGTVAAIDDGPDGSMRYLVPAPQGRLALVAEFTTTGAVDAEMQHRISALMTSFRWAA